MVLTNACRIAPTAYRDTLLPTAPTILQPSAYPAIAPLQWSYQLNQSSRAHSADLATTIGCAFQHDSCNGTSWSARIASYYPAAYSLGENIAAGYSDPLSTVNGWLLDPWNTGLPAADNSGNDGHRRNIMSPMFTQLGCGYGSGTNQYGRYWTQDFGTPQATAPVCSPLTGGSHIFQTAAVSFLATYYDNAAPQSASVVISGIASPMTVYLGTAARGTYRLTSLMGTSCRSYHFEFRNAAGVLQRFPARGELRTTGEGGCTEDYVAAPTPPACRVDIDGSGAVSVQDIFSFLNLWFAGNAGANFNTTGGITVQDIFDFLSAWFTGC
jgi:hypothetical protein